MGLHNARVAAPGIRARAEEFSTDGSVSGDPARGTHSSDGIGADPDDAWGFKTSLKLLWR